MYCHRLLFLLGVLFSTTIHGSRIDAEDESTPLPDCKLEIFQNWHYKTGNALFNFGIQIPRTSFLVSKVMSYFHSGKFNDIYDEEQIVSFFGLAQHKVRYHVRHVHLIGIENIRLQPFDIVGPQTLDFRTTTGNLTFEFAVDIYSGPARPQHQSKTLFNRVINWIAKFFFADEEEELLESQVILELKVPSSELSAQIGLYVVQSSNFLAYSAHNTYTFWHSVYEALRYHKVSNALLNRFADVRVLDIETHFPQFKAKVKQLWTAQGVSEAFANHMINSMMKFSRSDGEIHALVERATSNTIQSAVKAIIKAYSDEFDHTCRLNLDEN